MAAAIGCFVFCLQLAAQPPRPQKSDPSLGAILGPDGTLDPSPGFIGAVNAQGWRLVSGPDQPPRFAPAHQPARQGGSPQAVGDEDWDGRFAGPPGVNGVVRTVAVAPNGDVYVGGDFAMAINSSGNYFAANHVARWDGSGWSTLGSGVDNSVYALAIGQQGEVYVGGYFTNAGGLAASHVARWNGRVWSPLGSGVNNAVLSMAALGNDLYVGGYFDKAGNVNASGLPGGTARRGQRSVEASAALNSAFRASAPSPLDRAERFMSRACSNPPAVSAPTTSRSGMARAGRRWGAASAIPTTTARSVRSH